MAEPLVSVVVPVHDVLPYVRQALDSVVGQTYRNLDVVVVDDGSTDGSGDVCDGYAARDARVRVVHQDSRKPNAARNAGIDAAAGDWPPSWDARELGRVFRSRRNAMLVSQRHAKTQQTCHPRS